VRELGVADVALVTSYCADGGLASELVIDSPASLKIFYVLDTPVTLDTLHSGNPVPYLPAAGLSAFDLVLSYTGGRALEELSSRLGARRVAPLYGWVDTQVYRPSQPTDVFRSELSYLGTFAADRQPAVEELFVKPASAKPHSRFIIGGAQYPNDFPWKPNIFFMRHLSPSLHPAFFCSGRATLNVTRRSMAEYGYCPSGRLFEAAACGTAILSDVWEGLDSFFTPGSEVLAVHNAGDVLAALALSDKELRAIARAGRARALEEHSAAARALELEQMIEAAYGCSTGSASVLA
jgi:spore maturation protein CgeB